METNSVWNKPSRTWQEPERSAWNWQNCWVNLSTNCTSPGTPYPITCCSTDFILLIFCHGQVTCSHRLHGQPWVLLEAEIWMSELWTNNRFEQQSELWIIIYERELLVWRKGNVQLWWWGNVLLGRKKSRGECSYILFVCLVGQSYFKCWDHSVQKHL